MKPQRARRKALCFLKEFPLKENTNKLEGTGSFFLVIVRLDRTIQIPLIRHSPA